MKASIIFLMLLVGCMAQGQVHKENIKKELQFSSQSSDNLFILENINGSIIVEGYDGQKIIVEAVKTIKADTKTDQQKGKEEVEVEVLDKGDVILVYMKTPCSRFGQDLSSEELRKGRNWNWNNNCKWDPDYEFQFDYKVRVPKNTMIEVGTINQGDVTVRNVKGSIQANNINGSITLDGIANDVEANTINGEMNLTYAQNPTGESKFHSLNGDINAHFQKGLSADLFFETFNGELFTNLDNFKALPVELKKEVKKEKGIAYKIGGKSGFRVGSGSAQLDFQTFNGNVYIKE